MIANHIKHAIRNLFRDHVYSFINIGGLALGIAACILLLLWAYQELSFDKFHHHADSIYRVNASFDNSGTQMTWPVTPGPLATSGKQQIPEIESAVRIAEDDGTMVIEYGEKSFTEDKRRGYVDPEFFTLFNFPVIQGNPTKPFANTKSVMLTESVAKKIFGTQEPVGKIIRINKKEDFTVVGLVGDMPENSSLQYGMIFPFEILIQNYHANEYWKSLETDWGNYDYLTFVKLKEDTSADSVARELTRIHHANQKESESLSYLLQPLTKLHLYSADLKEEGIQTVRIFLIIAIAILLIACINYINLATARATRRAKEVGVRKTIGADRFRLMIQFLTESAILSIFAVLLSVVLIQLSIPFYNELSNQKLLFRITDPTAGALIGGALLSTWLISGIYPALVLSAFRPIDVIRGKLTISGGNSTFRKVLVVTQFTLSIIIIIGTFVIGEQLEFIQNKRLGFSKENTFHFGLRGEMFKNAETIKNELLKNPAIEAVSFANQNILQIGSTTGDTDWEGKSPDQDFMIHPMNIDENFISMMNMEIKEGNGFTGVASDSAGYILNETAVKEAGILDPVGKSFSLWNRKGTIIGVVKDFHHHSIHKKIEPTIFFNNKYWLWLVYVKADGKNNQQALTAAEQIWKQYNPAYPFEYHFLDTSYNAMYQSEQRIRKLFTTFAGIAICISCLGLFGLATFTTAQRVKEVGIRKVMGASGKQIVYLLSKDFLLLVCLAFLIAAPIAYLTMKSWLEGFAYRTSLSWESYVLTGVLVFLLAFLTMSVKILQTAKGNPVDSLRSE